MVEDANPTGALMVKEVSLGNFSLAQLKRLSVVKAGQKDESDGEEIWNWKSNTHLSNIPLF